MGDFNSYAHLHDSAKYQAGTLVSNWMEERELRRTQLKQLLHNKMGGTLRLDSFNSQMSKALQEVELTKVMDDDYVHFGDVIQLVQLETSAVLAVDTSDEDIRPGELNCAATAAPQITSPCARNSFVILRYASPSDPQDAGTGDDIIHYGQKLRLAVHPAALGGAADAQGGPRPLCLFSKPVTTTHCAKYTRNQLVGFTYRNTFETVWEVVTPVPSQRALSVGLEVLMGAPIMLVHCATQKPLLVEINQKYPNNFGIELELSARPSTNKGMKNVCEATNKGLLRGTLAKGESTDVFWTFIGGTTVALLPNPSMAETSADSCAAMDSIVAELQSHSGGIYPLERKLVTLSSSNSFQLAADELLLLLRQCGLLSVNERTVAALTAQFQVPSKPGILDGAALLAALRFSAGGTGSMLKSTSRLPVVYQ
eukprot:CAMPEP_0119111138 /NCGR_PEP_ID=MMETSP1180-20130426/34119_1 /TAXON_ID=3052 ORGANISM="Chlamydomonas cf sp, Strain CCMP681" /NCGR_SAMPLE_ID=MMETSP1180 /ASSEMBLY_ACC=CAM_ASM_000741 /LENGTH=424 /DNA_ID=CAMNT_0007097937 /DNA_START=15 /DNA_END=1289 /DNA_ORIENTATION=+